MIGPGALAVPAALSTAGAPDPTAGGLLARDLVFEERALRRRAVWTPDPLLARFPEIARALRSEAIAEVRLGPDDCVEPMPCYRSLRHQLGFAGERLVTVFAERQAYLGGAHGGGGASDFVWGRARGRRVRFGDIFTSWAAARPLLQQRLCEQLRSQRSEMEIECPPVDELAFGLSDEPDAPIGGPASHIEVRTSDYQLGSYAAGREMVLIPIDAPLLALVRPEYRVDFAPVG